MVTAEGAGGHNLSILCFTWNVGNAEPDERQLAAWLPEPGQAEWDIVAVGTQENAFKAGKKKDKAPLKAGDMRSLSQTALQPDGRATTVKGSRGDLAEEEAVDEEGGEGGEMNFFSQRRMEKDAKMWDRMVSRRLGKGYTVVKHVTLWEMRLTIYAKVEWARGLHSKIHHVQAAKSATGVGGVLANKGGLVVRLDFGRTSLAFCSCHLAAHAHKNEQRNKNCQEILRETEHKLGTKRLDLTHQFDHVFWMGDLNYRIDLNLAASHEALALGATPPPKQFGKDEEERHHAAVTRHASQQEWAKLGSADQLRASKAAGDAFAGFREGEIAFAPTFKVKRQQGTEYKNQRIPSYCDRVLWKSMPTLASLVQNTRYEMLPDVSTSDHKPVLAAFDVQLTETLFEVVAPMRIGSLFGAGGMHLLSPRGFGGVVTKAAVVPPKAVNGAAGDSATGTRHISGRRGGADRSDRSVPLVRITSLQLFELQDMDLGGGSDPYCIFFTNPPGLFAEARHAPATTVKQVKSRTKLTTRKLTTGINTSLVELSWSPPAAAAGSTLGGANAASNAEGGDTACPVSRCSWDDKELPLLRPHGLPPVKLPFVTLIIAVYDRDRVNADDLLGVALVPLSPPAPFAPGSTNMPDEYDIEIDQDLVHGNMTHGVGHIKASLRVSFGAKLEAALEQARVDGAGVEARKLSHHNQCMCTVS